MASYVLPYGAAEHETNKFAREVCERERHCTGWKTDRKRRGPRSVSCGFTTFSYRYVFGERLNLECESAINWGVRNGRVALVRSGEPHCHEATT
jgi:hypothetical protein